jgi:hypothetical protein
VKCIREKDAIEIPESGDETLMQRQIPEFVVPLPRACFASSLTVFVQSSVTGQKTMGENTFKRRLIFKSTKMSKVMLAILVEIL